MLNSEQTVGEGGCLGRVSQPELAFLPAAVVADQRVVGLLNVHIIPDAEDVTRSLHTPTHTNTHTMGTR